jgi:hypothetical protein
VQRRVTYKQHSGCYVASSCALSACVVPLCSLGPPRRSCKSSGSAHGLRSSRAVQAQQTFVAGRASATSWRRARCCARCSSRPARSGHRCVQREGGSTCGVCLWTAGRAVLRHSLPYAHHVLSNNTIHICAYFVREVLLPHEHKTAVPCSALLSSALLRYPSSGV